MIAKKWSLVKYRELATHGSGSATNNAGKTGLSPCRMNNVVRFSMAHRCCGVGTKFSTNESEIKSYF